MNNELTKLDYTTISLPELLLIQSIQIMTYYPHSKEYIEAQKVVIDNLDVRDIIKHICNLILNEVKIKEN